MGQFGTYWETQILKHITGQTSLTSHTFWMAACTAAPMTAAGTNVALGECQTNAASYARVAIATAAWTTVSGSSPAVVRNSAKISFATAASPGWGTISYLMIMNTSTLGQGEVLAWGACTNTAVGTGDTLALGTQSLALQIT